MTNEQNDNPFQREDLTARDKVRQVIDPTFLRILSDSNGGYFTFSEDPSSKHIAYTITPKRPGDRIQIFFNPLYFSGDSSRGIKPVESPEFFFIHEGGHHSINVTPLQDEMTEGLKNIEVPDTYKKSEELENRFLKALNQNLANGIADVWLEAVQTRRPYLGIRAAMERAYKSFGGDPSENNWKSFNRPQQFVQAFLAWRIHRDFDFSKALDPEVFRELTRVTKRPRQDMQSPMEILMDTSEFGGFSTPDGKERSLDLKYQVFKEIFVPSFVRLVEDEINQRKEQKLQGSGKGKQDGLSEKEEAEIAGQVLKELEGGGHEIITLSDDDKKRLGDKLRELEKSIHKRRELEKKGKKEKSEGEGEPKDPFAERDKLFREMERRDRESVERGIGKVNQVSQETVRTWKEIKQEYALVIEQLSSALSEIFLDDRRPRRDMPHREGIIIEGQEYETASSYLAGEMDPKTHYKIVRNPKFLETELEFIVDTSGSMSGNPLQYSVALEVIVTEAFKRVHETLENEELLGDDENPFRIGATKFSDGSERGKQT